MNDETSCAMNLLPLLPLCSQARFSNPKRYLYLKEKNEEKNFPFGHLLALATGWPWGLGGGGGYQNDALFFVLEGHLFMSGNREEMRKKRNAWTFFAISHTHAPRRRSLCTENFWLHPHPIPSPPRGQITMHSFLYLSPAPSSPFVRGNGTAQPTISPPNRCSRRNATAETGLGEEEEGGRGGRRRSEKYENISKQRIASLSSAAQMPFFLSFCLPSFLRCYRHNRPLVRMSVSGGIFEVPLHRAFKRRGEEEKRK